MNKFRWIGALLIGCLPWSAVIAGDESKKDDNGDAGKLGKIKSWFKKAKADKIQKDAPVSGVTKKDQGEELDKKKNWHSWFKNDKCDDLVKINRRLHGQIVDYTDNHGKDRRFWSKHLYQKRDMYVYLPPGYDPKQRYPLMIWMHGFGMDEQSFAEIVAPMIDNAIWQGKLPSFIVAAPDGSLSGEPSVLSPGSFFLNSQAGDFEDFILQDVWDFVVKQYLIRPEKQAHILAGSSMGGFGAFNLAIKQRQAFGVVVGVFPPLNLRWMSAKGRYFANFNPKDWGWRTETKHGLDVVARFYGGLIKVRLREVIDPLFGHGEDAIAQVARENPIEMVDRLHLKDGELSMYVAYGGKDEFNIDAQVESFLYLARCRGIKVTCGYDPKGRHDVETAKRLFPGIVKWLAPQVAPYSPPMKLKSCPEPVMGKKCVLKK